MAGKLKLVADKGKQECFIIREFDAPREMVFKAFSDPDLFVQFWGPDDRPMKLDYFHYKTGGSYRYRIFDKAGTELCSFSGVIHEVAEPERVVQTSEFDTLPERGHVVLETFLFEQLPDNKTKLTIHEVCRSIADRDAMIASGMDMGLEQAFTRLDKALLSGLK